MHEAIRRIGANLRIAFPETNRVYNEAESPPTVTHSVIGIAL